ncbi:hypothetical protein [Chryseobacterium sp. GM_Chr_2]|uniref:hypothetical protein n=2 Tax=Chryseobacterium TaxID=59732 RepID=UPI002269E5A3|nr:hypothetical protein [Chryseobacterium sp. GM_Chr_2]
MAGLVLNQINQTMKPILAFLFLIISLISCKEKKQDSIIKEKATAAKIYNLPNDEFREKVLPKVKQGKDKNKLTAFLDSLDKRNLSYCDLMKREYEIDDSCYDVARAKYPEPEMSIQFVKLHDETFDVAHAKFAKQINLTEKQINYITIFYYFDKNIKNFCGEY